MLERNYYGNKIDITLNISEICYLHLEQNNNACQPIKQICEPNLNIKQQNERAINWIS